MAIRLLALLLLTLPAFADECANFTICDRIRNYPIIFLGETITFDKGIARFRVIQNYRGLPAGATEVEMKVGPPTPHGIDPPYEAGRQTIIFTRETLRDGACSPSLYADSRSALLAYLSRLANGLQRNSIFGNVVARIRPTLPISGALVTAASASATFSVYTNRDGIYEFADLPPGQYMFRVSAAGHAARESLWPVGVGPASCDEQPFYLRAQNKIAGRITQTNGRPAPGIDLDLLHTDQQHRIRTGPNGEFEFENLEPGEYQFLISPAGASASSPTPRAIAPQIVPVRAGTNITNLKIEVPPLIPTRQIRIHVTGPDGKPVPRAEICISQEEFPFIAHVFTGATGIAIYPDFINHAHTISIRTEGQPALRHYQYQESTVPAAATDADVHFRLRETITPPL